MPAENRGDMAPRPERRDATASPGAAVATRARLITRTDHAREVRSGRLPDGPATSGQCAAWSAVVVQPSRLDMARAQLTMSPTWPEVSAARHSTDHGRWDTPGCARVLAPEILSSQAYFPQSGAGNLQAVAPGDRLW